MSQVIEELVSHINQQVESLVNQGVFDQAFQLGFERLGEQHPATATAISNLARLFWQFGEYQRAEEFFLRAIRIAETTIGKYHREYAIRLTLLAELCRTLGRYAETEPLLQEALALTSQWEQPDEELITSIWNNLA